MRMICIFLIILKFRTIQTQAIKIHMESTILQNVYALGTLQAVKLMWQKIRFKGRITTFIRIE